MVLLNYHHAGSDWLWCPVRCLLSYAEWKGRFGRLRRLSPGKQIDEGRVDRAEGWCCYARCRSRAPREIMPRWSACRRQQYQGTPPPAQLMACWRFRAHYHDKATFYWLLASRREAQYARVWLAQHGVVEMRLPSQPRARVHIERCFQLLASLRYLIYLSTRGKSFGRQARTFMPLRVSASA